uniref:SFRICE_016648 n=1 Tax=Spodoptera frugiperda TaxID=7108 RepID=A0A2H1VSC2_SPOFR
MKILFNLFLMLVLSIVLTSARLFYRGSHTPGGLPEAQLLLFRNFPILDSPTTLQFLTTCNVSGVSGVHWRRRLLTQLARWLGYWLPCNVSWVRFPHRTTLCVIHRLLFRVWVSCVCELESHVTDTEMVTSVVGTYQHHG